LPPVVWNSTTLFNHTLWWNVRPQQPHMKLHNKTTQGETYCFKKILLIFKLLLMFF
jgi:hypothetical protein